MGPVQSLSVTGGRQSSNAAQAASGACYVVMHMLTGLHASRCLPAGVFLPPDARTEEDYEITLGVNHFGPFYLTHLLLDNLKRNRPSRIINLG